MQTIRQQSARVMAVGMSKLGRAAGWFAVAIVVACGSDAGTAVNALNRVALIAISLTSARLTIGQRTQANVTLKNASGVALSGKSVTWTSGNAAVATVEPTTGMITALAAGATTISANSDGASASTDVTVVQGLPTVTTVKITVPTQQLEVGAFVQATALVLDADGNPLAGHPVTWSSSDPSVLTINATSGMIAGVGVGVAQVIATSDGVTGIVNLLVSLPSGTVVASLNVALGASSIAAGTTTQATATARDSSGDLITGLPVTWGTSDATVATVSSSGVVTGVATGTATITAASSGVTGTASVTVSGSAPATVATVSVALGAQSVAAGSTTQATATARDAAGHVLTGRAVSWTTSNSSIATVDAVTGVVTAVNAGAVLVTAACEGQTGNATLVVTSAPANPGNPGNPPPPPPPAAVSTVGVSVGTSTIVVGGSTQASALTKDASGNILVGRTIVWSTSDATVATVSSTGLVTGTGAGSATITAASEGKSGSTTLTVTPVPVAAVTVSLGTSSIGIGSTTQAAATARDAAGNVLTGRTVTWSSSNVAVARVSAAGIVTGINTGSATITATSEGKSGTATVTVTPATVASVTVSVAASTLAVGATTQATATPKDASGNTLTGRTIAWTTSDASIATVSSTGIVTATGVGSASITATIEGKSGTRAITVTPVSVASVTVSLAASSIVSGATTQATATTTDATGAVLTGRTITWSTSNAAVATVSATGLVTGVAVGSATITATSEGKSSGTTVTVTAAPLAPVASVAVSLGSSSIANATTTQATAVTKDASGTVLIGRTIAWTTSNAAVATVSTSGLVSGVAAGTATITATSEGMAGTATVTVTSAAPPPPPVATKLIMGQQPSGSVQTGGVLGASVQLATAAGAPVSQSGLLVTASVANGTAVLAGTLAATTDATGAASFSNLILTGSGAVTLQFTANGLTPVTSSAITISVPVGGPGANILSGASFETGWDGFTDWSGTGTPSGVSRDCTVASVGSCSIRRSWTPNPNGDTGSQFLYHYGATDHVWIRFYFKLTVPVTTQLKFARVYDTGFGTHFGGFYVASGSDIVDFGTDEENGNIATPIGLTQAQVVDGRWHSLEMDYWRNGDPSGYPSAAFWFDGHSVSLPDGTPVKYDRRTVQPGGTVNDSYWKGGRLYAGTRANRSPLGYVEFLATLNAGNTTTGQVNFDDVSISTVGPILP
jgi:uncharacterized protein YjdB